MKTLKRIAAVVTTVALTVGMCANCFAADTWGHYFGMNEEDGTVWYEGAEGKVASQTEDSWTAELATIGWGGVWGAQMYKKVDIKKGTEYQLKCTLKSTNCDKWVFIKVSKGETFAYGKWVRLKKGQETTIDETFTAAANADQITFGFGGEFGDRDGTDGTAHYAYADGGQDAIKAETDGDATYATNVSCSGFYLGTPAAAGEGETTAAGTTSTGTTTTTSTNSTVATGDFTPIACGAAAVIAAAVIVVFARKRESE